MAQNESATTGPNRYEDDIDLADVNEGDRIDPELIPRSPHIVVGEKVSRHLAQPNSPKNEDERTFSVRLIASGYRDQFQDVQAALVYDPGSELFARLSGHTSSGAWNQKERDWKVRDVGRNIEIVDQWDVEIPDLEEFGETEEEFVSEWAEILFDNIRYGDEPGDELQEFDGKKFRLRDYDGRTARVEYELVAEVDEMSALDINEYVTDTVDQRGRVNIGIKNASSTVTYVVLDPDSMDRLDGPMTQDSQSDGRLSIGSEFEGEEVTIGLLNVE